LRQSRSSSKKSVATTATTPVGPVVILADGYQLKPNDPVGKVTDRTTLHIADGFLPLKDYILLQEDKNHQQQQEQEQEEAAAVAEVAGNKEEEVVVAHHVEDVLMENEGSDVDDDADYKAPLEEEIASDLPSLVPTSPTPSSTASADINNTSISSNSRKAKKRKHTYL